jgi:hypothetical protein
MTTSSECHSESGPRTMRLIRKCRQGGLVQRRHDNGYEYGQFILLRLKPGRGHLVFLCRCSIRSLTVFFARLSLR